MVRQHESVRNDEIYPKDLLPTLLGLDKTITTSAPYQIIDRRNQNDQYGALFAPLSTNAHEKKLREILTQEIHLEKFKISSIGHDDFVESSQFNDLAEDLTWEQGFTAKLRDIHL